MTKWLKNSTSTKEWLKKVDGGSAEDGPPATPERLNFKSAGALTPQAKRRLLDRAPAAKTDKVTIPLPAEEED